MRGKIRREAQTSFALSKGKDGDKDGLPDGWERTHGLNPKNGQDGQTDPDRDNLNNLCELQLGTQPRNADSDGGGVADTREAIVDRKTGRCTPGATDPTNPADDIAGPLGAVHTAEEASSEGDPVLVTTIGAPRRGILISSDIYRTAFNASGKVVEPRALVQNDFKGDTFTDRQVQAGLRYLYEVIPSFSGGDTSTTGPPVPGGMVPAQRDP
jgi:hypothetical protein